jgi:zinc protease
MSRLYQSLVYDLEIAQDVTALQWSREMASIFIVYATAREGRSLDDLETALDSVLTTVLEEGVSESELTSAATGFQADVIRSMQEVGGFSGIADRLNRYNRYLGTPDGIEFDFNRYGEVTVDGIADFARRYLDPEKRATLRFVPAGDLESGVSEVDRSTMPGAGPEPEFSPPTLERGELDNGLDVLVVEDRDLPLVEVRLVIESGFASDPIDLPGVASLTAELLDEGTTSLSALEIDVEKKRLAADLSTGSFLDGSNLRMNVLKSKLDEGMTLFADIALNPSFPEAEVERQRAIYQGRIVQHDRNAQVAAIKTFMSLLYGEGHPYGQPYTGTGTTESIAAITRDDLWAFYGSNYRPNNAAIVFAGDISLEQAVDLAERHLGEWEAGEIARTDIPEPPDRSGQEIYIVDKPGVEQSVVMVGQLALKRSSPDYRAFQVVNTVLGGTSRSRINQNIREEKGYSYGAFSLYFTTRGTGPFMIFAPVQTDKTAESLVEILTEFREITSTRPASDEEVADAKGNRTKSLPQAFESLQVVAASAGNIVMYDLPDDAWQRFAGEIDAITPDVAMETASRIFDPESALIVIVGDRAKIEDRLAESGFTGIQTL